MLSTTSNILLTRSVGLLENVPNTATPAIFTVGPIGSVEGAVRSENAYCARVSFTVHGESVLVLLTATVRSTLSSAAEPLGAAMPPAPRELLELTLYWP